MSEEICRLCLSSQDLSPLFGISSKDRRTFSNILKQTTGLSIIHNDGLPQNICCVCTELVDSSRRLRDQSKISERKLLELGYKRKNTKRKQHKEEVPATLKREENEDFYASGLPELEIEVEFDRITDVNNEENNEEFNKTEKSNELVQPKAETSHAEMKVEEKKPSTRKYRRAAYLDLVEGKLDPKGLVKCKVCKKTVNKWPSFVSHAKLHLGFKFVCEYCGKSFISSTQLNRHCRSYHGMSRELQCKYCDYLALDNPQLMLHERREHTGERPFVCDLCGASYFNRRCLIQHIESHQTNSTVQCPKCPQLFKSRRHLAKHTYSAHTSKEFTYKCPVCSHIYRNLKYIRVHLKKMHGFTTKEASIIKIKL